MQASNKTDPSLSLDSQTVVPDHVLFQEASGSAALLNLNSETYFGLDEVGTAMWQALEQTDSVGAATSVLVERYDIAPAVLQADILRLVRELRAHDLIEIRR